MNAIEIPETTIISRKNIDATEKEVVVKTDATLITRPKKVKMTPSRPWNNATIEAEVIPATFFFVMPLSYPTGCFKPNRKEKTGLNLFSFLHRSHYSFDFCF